MASRWGDDIDEELQRDNRIKVGILFNYMHMGKVIKQLEEETREWDQKYPRNELLKIWGCDLFMIFLLMVFSYNILIVATGLFYIFYGHILIQIFRAWRRFKYPGLIYWLMTVAVLGAAFALAWLFRGLIFGG